MNAARLARSLTADGVEPKLAQSLAEHLAEEIDRTVATREQVETVVSREVQQLRVEMHEEFQRFDGRITQRLDGFGTEMTRRLDSFETEMTRRFDAFQNQITQRLDSQSRWLNTSLMVLFLAMLGNILKDFLR
jgi:DNA anti-recombination protein RmuC